MGYYSDVRRGVYHHLDSFTKTSQEKAWQNLLKKHEKYVTKDQDIDVPESKIKELQEEFGKELENETLKEIKKRIPKTFETFISSGISEMSTILGELSEKNNKKKKSNNILKEEAKENDEKKEPIVKLESRPRKIGKKGARPTEDVYYLTENYNTLYYILEQINQREVPPELKEEMLRDLMQSEYIKRVVKKDLVKTIATKQNLLIKPEDEKLILFFLERYPTVLYNTLKLLYTADPFLSIYVPEKHTNGFMMNLKNWAYKDMKETGDDFDVDYEVTVTVKDDDGKIVVKHTNSHRIHMPEEEEYHWKRGEARVIARYLLNNKDDPDSQAVVDEKYGDDEEMKKMIISEKEIIQFFSNDKFDKAINEMILKEDEELFIKGNGEEINKWIYHAYPGEDEAPY